MSISRTLGGQANRRHYGDLTNNLETQMTSMKSVSLSSWIFRPKPRSTPRVRLFCFPQGGGNASAFSGWAAELPDDVEVCAVQLPGRGARMLEPPALSIAQIIAGVTEALHQYGQTPVALFGHSLGAII